VSYAARTRRPRRSMLDHELAAVLKASGEHRDGFRDHVILSLAVGTALREHEIAALTLGDVSPDGRRVLRTIQLRVYKRSKHRHAKESDPNYVRELQRQQRIMLPDATYYKLEKYVRGLPRPRSSDRPLFLSERGRQISERRIRSMWRTWQQRAGILSPYSFHELRHTSISLYQERTADIRKTQLFARHSNIYTTTIYDHPRDQTLLTAVKGQPG
jgi:integrase/recombinase XerC